MTEEMVEKIQEHYTHAKEKHPYFCDGLLPTQVKDGMTKEEMIGIIAWNIQTTRERIRHGIKSGNVLWNEVLNCEVWEATEAMADGNTAAAIEGCYDAIAVLLRTIDVLEGRQELGNPTKEECEMKIKNALDESNICKEYEYDESGLGKIYGACCATCVNAHREKCSKTKGKNK